MGILDDREIDAYVKSFFTEDVRTGDKISEDEWEKERLIQAKRDIAAIRNMGNNYADDYSVNYKIAKSLAEYDALLSALKKLPNKNNTEEVREAINRYLNPNGDKHRPTCRNLVFTNNDDKLFFGLNIYPVWKNDDVTDIVFPQVDRADYKPIRVELFDLEIDSKMWDPMTINLNNDERTCLILATINKFVDPTTIDTLRLAINDYLVKTGLHINLAVSSNYNALLLFGIKDSMNKIASVFCMENDQTVIDQYLVRIHKQIYLDSAYQKLCSKQILGLVGEIDNDLFLLSYCLLLYSDVKELKLRTKDEVARMGDLSPSYLFRREVKIFLSRLDRIDNDQIALMNESFLDSFVKSSIDLYENQYYEFTILTKNMNDTDDAILLMNQINSRINLIEEYASESSGAEKRRALDLLKKYRAMRATFANKPVFKDTSNRLYIAYPEV